MADKPKIGIATGLTLLAVAASGAAIAAFAARRSKPTEIDDLRIHMEREISTLRAAIDILRRSVQPPQELLKPDAAKEKSKDPAFDSVSAEMALVISAAVTAYLGKKVKIRSAKALQTPYEIVNPWAQHGRVSIHASHTMVSRIH